MCYKQRILTIGRWDEPLKLSSMFYMSRAPNQGSHNLLGHKRIEAVPQAGMRKAGVRL